MGELRNPVVLIAEDDPDDVALLTEAFAAVMPSAQIVFVDNGEAVIAYLRRQLPRSDKEWHRLPSLLILDLNMPRKDGRSVLKELKADLLWKLIPVVVLTTSTAKEDIQKCGRLGATSYIIKPSSFSELQKKIELMCRYWLEAVVQPVYLIEENEEEDE